MTPFTCIRDAGLALVLLSMPWSIATAAVPTLACPAGVPGVVGRPFAGKTLTNANFSYQVLINADFSGATLDGVAFIGANLTGANFSGAYFINSQALPVDFMYATLNNACFQGAHFLADRAPTYFTKAQLGSADFSNTDLSKGTVLFGPSALALPIAFDRPRFRNTVMSCEFISQWPAFDMSGATGLQACGSQLKGFDFSNARLAGADFSRIDLSGTNWKGANLRGTDFQGATLDNATGMNSTDLSGALFNLVSARFVNFSNGKLYGASFIGADLEGANFANAFLQNNTKDPLGPISSAATFDNAHLKNVSFAGANLASVSFANASLYGSLLGPPTGVCSTDVSSCGTTPVTGGTCSCATLSGANLTRANFSGAYLYGVDLTTLNTVINGTTFDNAILVSANFAQATFQVDTSQGGAAPSFKQAWLQGANVGTSANLSFASLDGAQVDFGFVDSSGKLRTSNAIALLLGSNYTNFQNWSGSATPCVRVEYAKATVLPVGVGNMTCPNGLSYPSQGCGALLPRGQPSTPVNPQWKAAASLIGGTLPGWYYFDSTYENATATSSPPSNPPLCKGLPFETKW